MENNKQINWQEEINKITEAWATSPIGSFCEVVNGNLQPKPLTLKQKISLIPYYLGYYLSYPFLRLVYKVREGIQDACEDTWEK